MIFVGESPRLSEIIKRFKSQRHWMMMIVNNCPVHPMIQDLDAVMLVFLPPNAMSLLQSCDVDIIKNLKVKISTFVTVLSCQSE